MVGTIKVLKMSFGFITPTDGSKDVFFHAKNLPKGVHFYDLKEGDVVNFDVEETLKGPNAINMSLVQDSSNPEKIQ